jgi:hypothetical protein
VSGLLFKDQCAICAAKIETIIEDYTGGKTGEPVCSQCRDTEMQAEAVEP